MLVRLESLTYEVGRPVWLARPKRYNLYWILPERAPTRVFTPPLLGFPSQRRRYDYLPPYS